MEVELVPWDETGRAMLWSWPGQEGACAACATAALHEGLPVEGRAITACQECARCGTEIVAVDAGHDDDDDDDGLDLTEGDSLDAGEWDASEMELDICQMYESDASFPEPPVVEVGGADEPMARRIERAEQDAHRAGLKRALLDRGTGALLGHAIGDALGLAAELLSVDRARTWYPAGIRGYEDIVRDAHRGRWQPGEGPDDTGQMLALAAACAEPGVWHADGDAFERAFSARLKAWMESDTDPLDVAASVDRASRGRGAANGSLMRLTPPGRRVAPRSRAGLAMGRSKLQGHASRPEVRRCLSRRRVGGRAPRGRSIRRPRAVGHRPDRADRGDAGVARPCPLHRTRRPQTR